MFKEPLLDSFLILFQTYEGAPNGYNYDYIANYDYT